MVYEVIKNGNELVGFFNDLKKARKKFRSIADRGVYVEIWEILPEFGVTHLIDYAN